MSPRDSARRRDVLRVLRASADPMSIAAISDVMVVHFNTVRFHLGKLVADGLVERVGPVRKALGRPPLMFRAAEQMDRGGTRHYQFLAEMLVEALASERNTRAKALEAGRAWGNRLASLESDPEASLGVAGVEEAIDRLVGVLDDLGFAAERQALDGEQQISHKHCPFLELAENRPNIVCLLHLGLIGGILEAQGAPITAVRLDAFVTPGLCLLHVTPTAADE